MKKKISIQITKPHVGCYGTKVDELLKLIDKGFNVPEFYVVDLSEFNRIIKICGIMSPDEFYSLPAYNSLELKKFDNIDLHIEPELNANDFFIARSSSVPKEKSEFYASTISGAFESYECTGGSLVQSILEVYKSLYSAKAYLQIRLAHMQTNIKGMAVLIQKFIKPDYSGVLHYYHGKDYMEVNWVKGHLRSIVSGETSGMFDVLYKDNSDVIIKGNETNIYTIMSEKLTDMFIKLYSTIKEVGSNQEKNLEIEWLYCNGEVFLVQCQELIVI